MLLTGKEHISYSELKTWLECGWRHKLANIDKLGTFDYTIYTDFGHVVHSANEEFLKTRVMDTSKAMQELTVLWKERKYPEPGQTPGPDWPEWPSSVPDLQYWLDSLEDCLNSLPAFMEKEFPGWEFVAAEEYILEKMDNSAASLKAYIDGIIKVKDKKGNYIYHIVDWKNTGSGGWQADKKREPDVLLQLVLYKIFWSKKHNIPLKDVRCHFVFLKRHDISPKKRLKDRGSKRCDMMSVSVGPKTVEKATKRLRNMLLTMTRGLFLKNRFNCKFCEFHKTPHCK